MSALAARIGQDEVTKLFAAALHRDFGHLKAPIPAIAAAANGNDRAAKNWWEGKNAPLLLNALRLATKAPSVASLMQWLMTVEGEPGRTEQIIRQLGTLDPESDDPDRQMTFFAGQWVRP